MLNHNHAHDFIRLESKAHNVAKAFDIAFGTFQIQNNGSYLPLAISGTSLEAFNRATKVLSNYGPKILKSKLDGIQGSVINTSNERIKEILKDYDLNKMISDAATDLVVAGITALAIGVRDEKPVVFPLKGFVCNLPDVEDFSQTAGIFQAWNDLGKWEIRYYTDEGVYKWHKKKSLTEFLKPHDEFEESSIGLLAFTAVYQADEEGISVGEIEQAMPSIIGIMTQLAKLHRVSEIAIPRLVAKGQIADTASLRHVPDNMIQTDKDGDVKYLEAPSVEGLLNILEKLEDTLINSVSLPEGLFGNKVSGRSIELGNQEYNNSIDTYARLLSKLFSKAFAKLLEVEEINNEDFSITVKSKPIVDVQKELEDAIMLFDSGILNVEAMMIVIAKRFPSFDEKLIQQMKIELSQRNLQNQQNVANSILNNL